MDIWRTRSHCAWCALRYFHGTHGRCRAWRFSLPEAISLFGRCFQDEGAAERNGGPAHNLAERNGLKGRTMNPIRGSGAQYEPLCGDSIHSSALESSSSSWKYSSIRTRWQSCKQFSIIHIRQVRSIVADHLYWHNLLENGVASLQQPSSEIALHSRPHAIRNNGKDNRGANIM